MNNPSANTVVNPIQLIFKDIIRSTVAWKLSRKAVTPDFNLSNLFIGIAVNPFSIGDESANQSVVEYSGAAEPIHTTGGFPKGHTPEEFLDGNKNAIRRNKLITGVLYYSDDMETFATGFKRIKDLCDEAGCKVEFRTEVDDFVVAFYRNLREEWNKAENKNATSLGSTTKRLL